MSTVRIYTSEPLMSGQTRTLTPAASRHVSRVLRLGAGDPITVFDGSGTDYQAEIIGIARESVRVRVGAGRAVSRESPLHVMLLQGVSRGPRMDMVVQKATELGVTEILPVHTTRSVVHLAGERAAARLAHWRSIAASACEQCGRSVLPAIHPPAEFANAALPVSPGTLGLILHPDGAMAGVLREERPERVLLAIGPEGGFTPDELAAFANSGWTRLRLGPRILRTETAPIAALSVLQFAWGDLGGAG